jgi:hypothetical protein
VIVEDLFTTLRCGGRGVPQLQRVALKMDDDASSSDESILGGSQGKDSRGRKRWDVPNAQAARTFGVGATSVKRYVNLAEQGRSLEPGKAPGKQSKLGESGMRLLEEDLHERPTATYENRA